MMIKEYLTCLHIHSILEYIYVLSFFLVYTHIYVCVYIHLNALNKSID